MQSRTHPALYVALLLGACEADVRATEGAAHSERHRGVAEALRASRRGPDLQYEGDWPPADDPRAVERDGCDFTAGARAADTLSDLSAARAAITHIIVIMQENNSWDHVFGTLGHGTDGIPRGYANVDSLGHALAAHHQAPTCNPGVQHDWAAMHTGWNKGQMDGWARSGGHNAMGYLSDEDHPFYSWLATTFATSDRYFASVLGPTHPNRDYLYAATSNGMRKSYAGYPTGPLVFDELDRAGVRWIEYNASPTEAFSGALPRTFRNIHSYAELLPALAEGSLPPVSFVDLEPNDEHPPGSVHDGEIAMHPLIQLAFSSPLWPHLAIFFTYDEGGAYFDHVPPPTACLAAPSELGFDVLGGRVPVIVISPYARAASVSHRVHSHTSILRFIEGIHDLPALTARDANSDAMLDLFDFSAPPFMTPPATVPAPGIRDCGG